MVPFVGCTVRVTNQLDRLTFSWQPKVRYRRCQHSIMEADWVPDENMRCEAAYCHMHLFFVHCR